jgi:hypothetical protein
MIGGLFDTYQDYLNSQMWKDKKESAIKDHCEICGLPRRETIIHIIRKQSHGHIYYILKGEIRTHPLTVHHITYEHVCNEPIKDLQTVCFDCHKKIHGG